LAVISPSFGSNRASGLLPNRQTWVGTVIWNLPDGQTYVTTRGSALLFPTLCKPARAVAVRDPGRADRRGDSTVMMPVRKTTRAQNHAHRIAAERHHNRQH
jgi:hypothetical protein